MTVVAGAGQIVPVEVGMCDLVTLDNTASPNVCELTDTLVPLP